ncbi:MAG TPA: ribonuclease P protein component [Terriglobales bacterium]
MRAFSPNDNPDVSGSAKRTRFPRSSRLLRHSDFERVYKLGRRHFATHMTVFYLARSNGEGLRIGFTVGRVLGPAVDRNRIKRRLREAVRLSRPAQSAAVDVVINPKKTLLKAGFDEIQQEMVRAFQIVGRAQDGKPGSSDTRK